MVRLSHEDQKAVDVLLESMSSESGVTPNGGVSQRVGAVNAILSLLDQLPAADPSPQLLKKTLRLIESTPVVNLPSAISDAANLGQSQT